MVSFIISGASGFIGKWLIKELLNKKYKVYALVRKESIFKLNDFLNYKNFYLIETKYNDKEIHFVNSKKLEKECYFINLLWDGTSGFKRGDIEIQINNLKKLNLSINLAKKLGCKKFIGIGSIMEYEIVNNLLSENQINESTIYGFTKIASRVYGKKILQDLKLKWNWITITNSFGEYENSDRLINSIIKKVIKGDKKIYFNTNGLQFYDFIYIKNLVNNIIEISKNGLINKSYLILGEKNLKNLKFFIAKIEKVLIEEGHKVNFLFSKENGKELDSSFIEKNIVFHQNKKFISFEEGIRKVYKYLKNEVN